MPSPACSSTSRRFGPFCENGAELLVEDVNLHDAQPREWHLEHGAVVLTFLAGDLQRGYESVRLSYREAQLEGATPSEVARWLGSQGTEVWYDEVDLAGDSLPAQLLLWPEGEFSITFSALQVDRRPVSPHERR